MRTSLSPELDPGMESQVANSLRPLQSNYFITNHLLMVILNKYESQLSN
jgi:hypothetical protein